MDFVTEFNLKTGDIVAVKVKEHLSQAMLARFQDELVMAFPPDARIVVFEGDVELAVIKRPPAKKRRYCSRPVYGKRIPRASWAKSR